MINGRRFFLFIISTIFAFPIYSAQEKTGLNIKFSQSKIRIVKNLQDIISLIQVTENSLNECQNLLQKSREISVKGSNGIYSEDDRINMITEIKDNIDNYRQIIDNESFNGINIFFNKNQHFNSYKVTFSEVEEPDEIIIHSPNFDDNINILDNIINNLIATPHGFNITIRNIDKALDLLFKERSRINAEKNRIEFAIDFENIYIQNQNITNNILEKHFNKLIDTIYALTIQSVNGIYSDVDRYALNYEFQRLVIELLREEKLSKFKSKLSIDQSENILTQENAENIMRKIIQELKFE